MTFERFEYVGGRKAAARGGPCSVCEGRTVLRDASDESPYFYSLSGLKNVYLVGISIRRCIECGAESPIIPRIVDLHKAIVLKLVYKSTALSGDEIRFLRKNAGLTGRKLAALLGVDPSHVSRVETGKLKGLGTPADLLARAVVLAESTGGESVREILLKLAEQRAEAKLHQKGSRKRAQRVLFRLTGNRWAA